MSTFGVGNIGSVNLASSVAGTQKNNALKNEARAEAAGRDFKTDLDSLTIKQSGDVGEAELSSDRDVDGRLLGGHDDSEEQETTEEESASSNGSTSSHPRSVDPNHELGSHLDLDA